MISNVPSFGYPHIVSAYVSYCLLGPLQNGYYVGLDDIANGNTLPIGRLVTMACNHGYRLVGNPTVECGPDGNTQQLGICEGMIIKCKEQNRNR